MAVQILLSLFITFTVFGQDAQKISNVPNVPKIKPGGKEFTVFNIQKNVAMTDEEVPLKDYYVNIGAEHGVRAGQYLAVYRRIPVTDIFRNKVHEDFVVPIGHLKILTSQKTSSVARIAALVDVEKIPVVQYNTVMLGDRVELVSEDSLPKTETPVKEEPKLDVKPEVGTTLPPKRAAASEQKPLNLEKQN